MKKRASNKPEKVIEIDFIKFITVVAIALMCVLAAIGVINVIKSFMVVTEFEVSGVSPYDRDDIVKAASIRPKSKLYEVDYEATINRIKTELPYINDVKIESKFPNKIKITVESAAPTWYIESFGDFYALDTNLTVLEEAVNDERFVKANIPKLVLPNVKYAVVGSVVEYGANQSEVDFSEEFIAAVNGTTFKSRLTLVNIEHRFEIYVQVDGVIDVYMGNTDNASAKLDAIETALADKRLENCISADIDVSNLRAISIRPVYDYTNGTEADSSSDEN